jgi:D-glycero-D-manno-heptose 1,7-bisphosphate phosphatase
MKLAILDKDGTLTQPKSGSKFVQSPDDQELMPGVKKAIAALVADGYRLVIASNQGGIEAGHKSLDDAIAEMRYCMELLPEIDSACFCPDFAGKECWLVNEVRAFSVLETWKKYQKFDELKNSFRKPNPGMLYLAQFHYFWHPVDGCKLDPASCLMIGDRPEDEQAAEGAGIPFIHADVWRKG